jgi:predicted AlkP superfamily phosphohydrolase/phosphomutase
MSPDRPFPHVICVGLDGATFDVIDPMVKDGRLPTLARLLSSGTRAHLRSTVPPLSAPAWVTFMTGTNPGAHGIFHFRTMRRGVLGPDLVGSWSYRGQTIFDHASRGGRRVVAARVPMTYPPWEIAGLMVSGFPTPDPRTNFSVPPEVGRAMPSLFRLSPVGSMVAGPKAQIDNLDHYLERSTTWLVDLLREGAPDLFCYVNSVTDWAAHKFWRSFDPAAPGYERVDVDGHPPLEHLYEGVDASLGALLEAAPSDALVVVLSDHGTGPRASRRFHPNAWLRQLGLAEEAQMSVGRRGASRVVEWAAHAVPKRYWLWRHAPRPVRASVGRLRDASSSVDLGRSQASAVLVDHHVAGVNVNLAGRDPSGVVPLDRYEAVRERVIAAAPELVDRGSGARVIRAAHRREDLFAGDHLDGAPDVLLELDEAFEVGHGGGGAVLGGAPARPGRSSATHRPHGILAMTGPGVRAGHDLGEADLIDVPETLLWALGLEVPEAMEGSVLMDAFEDEVLAAHPVRRVATPAEVVPARAYTQEEEEQMTAHLEDLGYL